MTSVDWLPSQPDIINGDTAAYSLDEIRKGFEVRQICEDGYLILSWDEERLWLKFAVMEFFYGEGAKDKLFLQCIFHGDGPTGNLREFRHTYWGDNGYIFYAKKEVIIAGLNALSEFFDLD